MAGPFLETESLILLSPPESSPEEKCANQDNENHKASNSQTNPHKYHRIKSVCLVLERNRRLRGGVVRSL